MTKRTKIISAIVIAVVIIAGLATYLALNYKNNVASKNENTPVPKVSVDTTKEVLPKFAPPTAAEQVASSVKSVAIMFAEKFGTYSNQANYLNVSELMPLMSDTMTKWAREQYLPKLLKDHDPAGFYYQIVTNAPVATVTEQKDDSAKVLVSTQRIETVGKNEPVTFLQDLIVTMVKKGNSWLVDGAFWQPKK